MKNIGKIAIVLMFVAAAVTLTCSKPAAPAANVETAANTQTYQSVGVIKAIDVDSGKVRMDHEDIPGYMSAMEMNEPVADRSLLSQINVGDKVEFEIVREGMKVKFTKFNKIGEVAAMKGEDVYKANCAECHGATGQGGKKGIPLTSGHALAHTETEYVAQVNNGEGKKMPPFKDRLSVDEIAAVVKYVRGTIQKDVTNEQREHHHH